MIPCHTSTLDDPVTVGGVRFRNRLHATGHGDVAVFCEGGVRARKQCDRLLGPAPANRQPISWGWPGRSTPNRGWARACSRARTPSVGAATTVPPPQVTGAEGRCRTPETVRERARLTDEGVYERQQ
jgi:hypothetical protein